MRIQSSCFYVGLATAGILAFVPSAYLLAEIAGIPEVHETAVLDYAPMGTNGAEILVGDPDGQYNGVASGIVHVLFRSDGSSWTEVGEIGPAAPMAGMSFGSVIAVSGSQALVSAAASPSPGLTFFLFNRTATGTWIESAAFVGDADYVLSGRTEPDLCEDTIVINGSAGVSVFERDGNAWPLQQHLVSPDEDAFATSFAVSSDALVIGASSTVVAGVESGAAYVYAKPASGIWEFAEKLVASHLGMEEAYFGLDVAVAGDLIVVGSPCDWALGPEESCAGAAYIYRRSHDGDWVQEAKILPPFDGPTPPYGAQFGHKVAIEDGLVYVCENAGRWETGESGSCWTFRDFGNGDWQPIARLIPHDQLADPYFAEWIDLESGTLLSLRSGGGDVEPQMYVFDTSVLALEQEVALDFKPRNPRNVINPRSRGRFWLATLSEADFDALQVDPESVALGEGGASPDRYRVKDVNRDRLPDLMLRFRTPEVGLQCGDTEVELTGETFAGDSIIGTDKVKTVGCKKKPKKGKKK
jgi:hypothetical protein